MSEAATSITLSGTYVVLEAPPGGMPGPMGVILDKLGSIVADLKTEFGHSECIGFTTASGVNFVDSIRCGCGTTLYGASK